MPENWLYVVGGILIAMLVFVIAYNLLTINMVLAQKQIAITNFNDLHTDIENICLMEINNSMLTKIAIPTSIRVLYVTDDVKNLLPTVVENISKEDITRGKNVCMQFIDEQTLRCKKITCDVTMPYMGSLPEQMDIKIMVKKILGEAPVKEYDLRLTKVLDDEVEVNIGGNIE